MHIETATAQRMVLVESPSIIGIIVALGFVFFGLVVGFPHLFGIAGNTGTLPATMCFVVAFGALYFSARSTRIELRSSGR